MTLAATLVLFALSAGVSSGVTGSEKNHTATAQSSALLQCDYEGSTVNPSKTVFLSHLLDKLQRETLAMHESNPLMQSLHRKLDGLRKTIDRRNIGEMENMVRDIKKFIERFAVIIGVFAMQFKDMNHLILRFSEQEMGNPQWTKRQRQLAQLINEHCFEDGTHHTWLLSDLRSLGLDESPLGFSQFAMFWYGDEMESSRVAGYQMIRTDAKFGGIRDPLVRYVLIEAVEMSGKEIFELSAQLNIELHRALDIVLDDLQRKEEDSSDATKAKIEEFSMFKKQLTLEYFGPKHRAVEQGVLETEQPGSEEQLMRDYSVSADQSKVILQIGREAITAMQTLLSGAHSFQQSAKEPILLGKKQSNENV